MFKKIKIGVYKSFMFCTLLYVFGVVSCNKHFKKNELLLNSKYTQIEDINTIANCKGPNGEYTTKVVSKKNGELLFTQIFSNERLPFKAKLSAENNGFVIDDNKKILDTLTSVSVEMIRSHDFHRLQTNPEYFFNQIKFEKKLDAETELFTALDRLNNPVKIYYDRAIKQLKRVEFRNMMDTTEVIEIVFKKWSKSDYGKLAKVIEIIQAKKDTFNFNFQAIKINTETLKND